MGSKIEWTEETWNPITGCTKCSDGCLNCYAASFAKRLKAMGINYQSKALFVGQDIDRIAAQMCYIQLALNGCTGYVCVADAMMKPVVVDENGTLLMQPGQEFWFTPFYTMKALLNEETEKIA